MKLVIVESPTKAKTLSRFLGEEFEVVASYGHIRDLPKGAFGIEAEGDVFAPRYVIPKKAQKHVNGLKKKAARTDEVILATDEDREGEAIAWHIAQVLGLAESNANPRPELSSSASDLRFSESNDPNRSVEERVRGSETSKVKRIVFHEITKRAIEDALKRPRSIDMHLVNAQQARRFLDRMVGYRLSPLLWKKVARRLSAGRVQSVALRLLVEREREIVAFVKRAFYTVQALLEYDSIPFTAVLSRINDRKLAQFDLTKEDALRIVEEVSRPPAEFSVISSEKKTVRRRPSPPFTTSTLQQTAWQRLRFPAKFTMRIAQRLYEGVDLKDERVGLITYMRTDSVHVAQEAVADARAFIASHYGAAYLPQEATVYRSKSTLAQEAHEAIRPTQVKHQPESVRAFLSPQECKVYQLIWQRFVACQMAPAVVDQTTLELKRNEYSFLSSGSTIQFDGFLKVWPTHMQEKLLPRLNVDQKLLPQDVQAHEHFTQPPPRFTEATIVKTLEEYGIGRPSTYAPIISTIQERGYVEKDEKKALKPTKLGVVVNDLLVAHFPDVVDYQFTAGLEGQLDEIAQGKGDWQQVLRKFYQPFHELVERKTGELSKMQEVTEERCEECGAYLIRRISRFGEFLGCSRYPECRFTKRLTSEEDAESSPSLPCPSCGQGMLVKRFNKKNHRRFYGCSSYPDCTYTVNRLTSNSSGGGVSSVEELSGVATGVARKDSSGEPISA